MTPMQTLFRRNDDSTRRFIEKLENMLKTSEKMPSEARRKFLRRCKGESVSEALSNETKSEFENIVSSKEVPEKSQKDESSRHIPIDKGISKDGKRRSRTEWKSLAEYIKIGEEQIKRIASLEEELGNSKRKVKRLEEELGRRNDEVRKLEEGNKKHKETIGYLRNTIRMMQFSVNSCGGNALANTSN